MCKSVIHPRCRPPTLKDKLRQDVMPGHVFFKKMLNSTLHLHLRSCESKLLLGYVLKDDDVWNIQEKVSMSSMIEVLCLPVFVRVLSIVGWPFSCHFFYGRALIYDSIFPTWLRPFVYGTIHFFVFECLFGFFFLYSLQSPPLFTEVLDVRDQGFLLRPDTSWAVGSCTSLMFQARVFTSQPLHYLQQWL